MKAPAEVRQQIIDTLRAIDKEIQEKERVHQLYLDGATQLKNSLKELRKKRKEYSSFGKKIDVTEVDVSVGEFIPWDGELPEMLINEERNAKLAGIFDSLEKEERHDH